MGLSVWDRRYGTPYGTFGILPGKCWWHSPAPGRAAATPGMSRCCNSKSIALGKSLMFWGGGVLGSCIGLSGLCCWEVEQEGRACKQPADTAGASDRLSFLLPTCPAWPVSPPSRSVARASLTVPGSTAFPSSSRLREFVHISTLLPGLPPSSFPFPLGMCPLLFLTGISVDSPDVPRMQAAGLRAKSEP